MPSPKSMTGWTPGEPVNGPGERIKRRSEPVSERVNGPRTGHEHSETSAPERTGEGTLEVMTTSAQVRSQLVDALRLDLVGPRPSAPGHARYREEVLPISPSKWYLTGFLVPYEAPVDQRSDDDGDDNPFDPGSRTVPATSVTPVGLVPLGQPERYARVAKMVAQMEVARRSCTTLPIRISCTRLVGGPCSRTWRRSAVSAPASGLPSAGGDTGPRRGGRGARWSAWVLEHSPAFAPLRGNGPFVTVRRAAPPVADDRSKDERGVATGGRGPVKGGKVPCHWWQRTDPRRKSALPPVAIDRSKEERCLATGKIEWPPEGRGLLAGWGVLGADGRGFSRARGAAGKEAGGFFGAGGVLRPGRRRFSDRLPYRHDVAEGRFSVGRAVPDDDPQGIHPSSGDA